LRPLPRSSRKRRSGTTRKRRTSRRTPRSTSERDISKNRDTYFDHVEVFLQMLAVSRPMFFFSL